MPKNIDLEMMVYEMKKGNDKSSALSLVGLGVFTD